MAQKLGGKIVFYTAEDFQTLGTMGVIKSKIEENQPGISGIVFFTLRQFFYSGELNLKFMHYMLDRGLEIHCSRENLSITSREELDEKFSILYATQYVLKRDDNKASWKHILDDYQSPATTKEVRELNYV